VAGIDHVGSHELAHDERRGDAPVERVAEVVIGDVEETRVSRAADVVDQNVDAPETIP
jgi:hypothetical protein